MPPKITVAELSERMAAVAEMTDTLRIDAEESGSKWIEDIAKINEKVGVVDEKVEIVSGSLQSLLDDYNNDVKVTRDDIEMSKRDIEANEKAVNTSVNDQIKALKDLMEKRFEERDKVFLDKLQKLESDVAEIKKNSETVSTENRRRIQDLAARIDMFGQKKPVKEDVLMIRKDAALNNFMIRKFTAEKGGMPEELAKNVIRIIENLLSLCIN